MRTLSLWAALLLSSCGAEQPDANGGGAAAAERAASPPSFDRLDPDKVLGAGWHPGTMLVVRDWKQVDELQPAQREAAAMLRGPMQQQGVVSLAELNWSRKEMPIDLLSLRVLRFADTGALTAYRKLKYGGLRGTKLKPVADAAVETYDVVENGKFKRIAFFGDFYVSSQHLHEGDVHGQALDAICAQLRGTR